MKPLDPRLLRYARTTRTYLVALALLGTVAALLLIAQAWLLAEVITRGFQHGAGVGSLHSALGGLAVVTVGRALLAWLTELAAFRASAAVKSQLRGQLLAHAVRLGPSWLTAQRTGELVTLATRGVDALDGYFSKYLPQLVLAVTVPISVLAVVFRADWVSAVTILVTLPLIPLFMALIGMATQRRVERERRALDSLAGYFLDVVAGLPTLKVFGRAKSQGAAIRRITGDYRRATLRTLRLAFVSSFALELLATISVALVAVGIGLRLVSGGLDLRTGLLVLILAPEAYLPLRQVGAYFHASAEGVAAAERVFEVLETGAGGTDPSAPAGFGGFGGFGDAGDIGISVRDLTVRYEGRSVPALAGFSLEVGAGECVAIVGPSGTGKSTLLKVLLGFVEPESGSFAAGGVTVSAANVEAWRSRVAWVPQHPYLFAGTVAENVRLARPDASADEVRTALRDAAAGEFVAALPDGLETVLGEDGSGLSAGQRQRIGLARAFLADRPVLLLDEPTANLDGAGEAAVIDGVRRLARHRTVILIAHRPALLGVADRVVRLDARDHQLLASDTPDRKPEVQPAERTPRDPVLADPVPADPMPGSTERASARAASGSAQPSKPLRRLLALARSARSRLTLAALLGAAALGSSIGLMAIAAWLISRASQQPPVMYLMVAITAVRACGLGRAAFRYAERLVAHDAAFRILTDLRVQVYERLSRLAPAGLRTADGRAFRRGDLLSRLVADVDGVQDFYLRFLLPAAAAAVVGTAVSAALAMALPAAGLALAVGLLIAGIAVPWFTARTAGRAEEAVAPAKGDLATDAVDLLRGAPELIAALAITDRLRRLAEKDRTLERAEKRSAAVAGLGAGLTTLATGATVWACAYAGLQAVHGGRMAGILLAVVVLTPLAAFEATAGMPLAAQYLHRSRSAAARVFEIVDTAEPVGEPDAPAAVPAGPYRLEIRGLTANWPGRERPGTPALQDIHITLAPGRSVAVVGPSGSGKTTLIHTLLRFLDPTTGSITLNGIPTNLLAGDDVRRVIGLCAQDAHVFDSTLRENLRLAKPEAAEAELWQVLADARLGDWVESLPEGLDTFVGEHGARLSGGQRQRLALARTLLADFPVLLLDEPTEHLDVETADALTRDLVSVTADRAARGGSTLIVSHRLAGIEEVDEIVVLDAGRVVERGSWAELQADQDGVFHSLWEREQRAETLLTRCCTTSG